MTNDNTRGTLLTKYAAVFVRFIVLAELKKHLWSAPRLASGELAIGTISAVVAVLERNPDTMPSMIMMAMISILSDFANLVTSPLVIIYNMFLVNTMTILTAESLIRTYSEYA